MNNTSTSGVSTPPSAQTPPPVPPQFVLARLITGYAVSQLVYVAAKLGLADLLGEGPQSVERLAERTQTDRNSLHRMMRGLAAVGVLRETEHGLFELSDVGAYLQTDLPGSLGAMAVCSDESYLVWGHLLHTVRTGETAFHHVFGMDRYQYLEQHQEAAGSFSQAMAGLSARMAAALIAAYDFSAVGRVVDVGGGSGALLKAILRANPTLSGVLCDTPYIIAGAADQLSGEDLAGRCEVFAGNFFESVPAGGDLYILSHVLHNWDDESCLRILGNCRAAVGPKGRLLIAEIIMPARPGNAFSTYPMVMTDLQMLIMTGGRERTEREFGALLSAAGFEVARVIPTRALESLIECAPA